jgi:hypothetical protein
MGKQRDSDKATLAEEGWQGSYDNAGWHYGGTFPSDLPEEAGGTHIGMFLAWMWLHGLESETVRQELKGELALLRRRQKTPGDFLMNVLGEKLVAEDFSEEGNAFIKAYYDDEKGAYGRFIEDYSEVFDVDLLPSIYHVADNWENYDKLAKIIDGRFDDWKRKRGKKRFWPF